MNRDLQPRLQEILELTRRRELSPEVALMQLLIATENIDQVKQVIHSSLYALGAEPPLRRLSQLLVNNRDGCARIVAMLRSNVDTDEPAPSVEEGIAFCRRLFDWSVQQSEESSVALYSLGNPRILEAATEEVVTALEEMEVLDPARSLLDIGCGIGRLEHPLSGRVREIVGIDVSEKMIAAARRRCAKLPNVTLMPCDGHDLSLFPDARFDLALAVDAFPYLVQSGMPLVERYFSEARRVLRAGGDLVILGFSYGQDDARDAQDVARIARAADFQIMASGVRPFKLWNAAGYHLRRGAKTN